MGLMKTSVARTFAAAVTLALAAAGAAHAQKIPSAGTHITVSKTAGAGMFTTVQAAVNAAQAGQVIEILDESEYAEQVTIDGRETHPWGTGVVGGKAGITLRYVPAQGNAARPVIKWQDITNRSPKDTTQAKVVGDGPGASGNYETNGALRILRTSGITIEGIIVDGGGIAPFSWSNIWGSFGYPLIHGNAAVTLVVSGNVQIRDCELRNAYFGLHVKDRNTGGVFGNPNPDDHDLTIPLSGFGKAGGHLFEYNKIGGNVVGFKFESSWDLGSTIRHNLIYRNFRRAALLASEVSDQDQAAGGIMLKDNYLSPLAIYNNTFFENTQNIYGTWQVGAQHLVFNNIFGRKKLTATGDQFQSELGSSASVPNYSYTNMDGNFPYRMKHSVFAADYMISVQTTGRYVGGEYVYDTIIGQVGFSKLGNLLYSGNSGISAGAAITLSSGYNSVNFPADANNRWLETAGGTFYYSGTTGPRKTLPNLFKSLDSSSADFLVPDWDAPEVAAYIRNAGWPASGVVNADGTVADLGAIPHNGKRPCDGRAQVSRARVTPYSVVTVSGTTANAKFMVTEEAASNISNLQIKYIRWVAPIPDNTDAGSGSVTAVPAAAVQTISVTGITVAAGANDVNFTLPAALTAATEYGFFELVLEGVNAIGQKVVTDVGFLPYRKLDQYLDIQVVDADGAAVADPVVVAGDPVKIRVAAMKSGGAAFTGTAPLEAEFRLSDASASMWQAMTPAPSVPLVADADMRTGAAYIKVYTVYFTKTGSEVVSASGVVGSLPFHGTLSLTVVPQAPASVAFLSPVPKSMLGGAAPPAMTGFYPVEVQVRDRFGNPVSTPAQVSLVSSNTEIATVLPAVATTDPVTGVASFLALTSNGAVGDVFDLTASIAVGGVTVSDVASLRIGRNEDNPDPVLPPGVTGGGYVFADGIIRSLGVSFNREASADWIGGMEIAFGAVRASVPDMGCIAAEGSAISLDFACAFPGATIPEAIAASGQVVINFASQYGWPPVTLTIANGIVGVKERPREIPNVVVVEEAAVIMPISSVGFKFTAGPNPVSKSTGSVGFFINLPMSKCSGTLTVYDAVGNVVRKINVRDDVVGATVPGRSFAAWDLRDGKGRAVPSGTYLVRGALTVNGKREVVSAVVGVR